MSTRAAPPPPAPKPGRVRVYKALYDFKARTDQELTFYEGDLLYVSDQQPNNEWFTASIGGRKGLVPVNYVVSENAEELPNPLHEAARRGNLDLLSECLREQVSVNSLDKSGSTPIYWASHGGHIEAVNALLSVPNCEVNSQNKLGDTPLHAASYKGHSDVVQTLLNRSANPFLRNIDNKTPLDVAKDADVAALLDQRMKSDTTNEQEYLEYQSHSDED